MKEIPYPLLDEFARNHGSARQKVNSKDVNKIS